MQSKSVFLSLIDKVELFNFEMKWGMFLIKIGPINKQINKARYHRLDGQEFQS